MTSLPAIPTLTARRYVQPLREGGSLPAVVDTDDGLFVVKFRGAGQGAKALVAELIGGMLAVVIGLPVPMLALVYVPETFGRSEPDPEIADVLRKSHGMNVGMRYLDGAFNFDASAAGDLISRAQATRIVWLDALITNPDRTARNTNMLIWERSPWLIDHGAALYAHHNWAAADEARMRSPFPLIRDHVLLTHADDITTVDTHLAAMISPDVIDEMVKAIPDALLSDAAFVSDGDTPSSARNRYRSYLTTRLASPRAFVAAATEMRAARLQDLPVRRTARR
ncbi:MAG: aminotransferase class I and II [Gemmatimonadota bacterium]|nr:aminotransferase class I and II [Gemmatimonadota bacterium]